MESELQQWRAAWNAPGQTMLTPAFDFHAEYRRQQRGLRFRYLFGIGFAVALIAYAIVVLRGDFRLEVLAWAIVVWITTVGVTAFSMWNWRGLWRASACSIREYADIYEQRSLATLRAIRFGYWFLALQLSISVPWLTWDFGRAQISSTRYGLAMGSLALLTAAFLFWFPRSRRRASLELSRVQETMRMLVTCDSQEAEDRNQAGQ